MEEKKLVRTVVALLIVMFFTVRGLVAGFIAVPLGVFVIFLSWGLVSWNYALRPYTYVLGTVAGLVVAGVMYYFIYDCLGGPKWIMK